MASIRERAVRGGTAWDVRWETPAGHRTKTYRDHTDALLAKLAVERGDNPGKNIPDGTTLGVFWDGFERRWEIGKAAKTVETMRHSRRLLKDLDGVPVSHLTAGMVEDALARIAGEHPRSAQIALTHLRMCLRNAQRRDHAVDARIFEIPQPRYAGREIRFLTWDEVERVQSFLPDRVNRIVPVAALTGMRKLELFELTDDRFNRQEGFVELRAAGTKSRKPRRVWLSKHARRLLLEQLAARHPSRRGYVFAGVEGGRLWSRFEGEFRQAVKLARVEGATFHSLRHTCASLMIRQGCNPLEIAEQLGHLRGGRPDPTMIWQRYGWLYESATKTAVMRLDDVVEAAG